MIESIWTRIGVYDAEGSKIKAPRTNQRRARVEADAIFRPHEGIASETGVIAGVGHHHDFRGENGPSANGHVAGGFA